MSRTKLTMAKIEKAHAALDAVIHADNVLDHMSPVGVAYLARAKQTLTAYLVAERDGWVLDDD